MSPELLTAVEATIALLESYGGSIHGRRCRGHRLAACRFRRPSFDE
jgi:hypothetical protein